MLLKATNPLFFSIVALISIIVKSNVLILYSQYTWLSNGPQDLSRLLVSVFNHKNSNLQYFTPVNLGMKIVSFSGVYLVYAMLVRKHCTADYLC